jgi:hypothetical protein
MLRTAGGRPGWRRLLVSYFPAASRRCQAISVAGVTGKTSAPALPRDEPREHREPGAAGGLVPYPAGVPAQHCVLVPEHQQPGVLRAVPADHQDSQAEQPAHQQADDLQQHLASQPLPHRPRRRHGQVSDTIEFPSGTRSIRAG